MKVYYGYYSCLILLPLWSSSSSSCLCNAKTTTQVHQKVTQWSGKKCRQLSCTHAIKNIKPPKYHWCFWECVVGSSRHCFWVFLGFSPPVNQEKTRRRCKKIKPLKCFPGMSGISRCQAWGRAGRQKFMQGGPYGHAWSPHSWQVSGQWVVFCWQGHLLQLRGDFGRSHRR